MKKLAVVIVLIMIAAILCSCGSNEKEPLDEPLSQELYKEVPENLTDEKITEIIDKHILIDKYLNIEPPETGEDELEIDGTAYRKIVDETLDERQEWETLLKSVYTDDTAETILSGSRLAEHNGAMYIKSEYEFADILKHMMDEYTYSACIDGGKLIISAHRDFDPSAEDNKMKRMYYSLTVVETENGFRVDEIRGATTG